MKKTICALMALAMILTFAACGKSQEPPSGIFYDITGIAPDETVMEVDGNAVPAELYFYWTAYNCSLIDYQILNANAYYGAYSDLVGEDGALIWDGELSEGQTVNQFALAQVEDTVTFYAALENMAKEYGVEMTEEDKETMAANRAAAVEELGSEEAFQDYLAKLGLREENFERLSMAAYLMDGLTDLVLEEGSPLYLAPEDYDQYATYADHILLSTKDATTGASLSEEEIAAKRSTAEDLLSQLQKAENVEELFAQLADEYSEDPGRASNPTGYIYTPGSMVSQFEDAASVLAPGEISGIVESDYGFHIILRRDLMEGLDNDPDQKRAIAETHMQSLVELTMQEAEVTRNDVLADMDPGAFYVSYTTRLDELAAAEEAENAAGGTSDGTSDGTSNGTSDGTSDDTSDGASNNSTAGSNDTADGNAAGNDTADNTAENSGENG